MKTTSERGRLMVLGDLHGAYRAFEQVLERSGFRPGVDRLIFLGDVCDGWPEIVRCIRKLQSLDAICIWGNHDLWTWEWLQNGGQAQPLWVQQGGMATLLDFQKHFGQGADNAREKLEGYFSSLKDLHYEEDQDFLFVHGGFPPDRTLTTMPPLTDLTWDRDLFRLVLSYARSEKEEVQITKFRRVFLGHTTTEIVGVLTPITAGGVTLLDQGGGWSGKLSIMDADTGEYWQSDMVPELYPEIKNRRGR